MIEGARDEVNWISIYKSGRAITVGLKRLGYILGLPVSRIVNGSGFLLDCGSLGLPVYTMHGYFSRRTESLFGKLYPWSKLSTLRTLLACCVPIRYSVPIVRSGFYLILEPWPSKHRAPDRPSSLSCLSFPFSFPDQFY